MTRFLFASTLVAAALAAVRPQDPHLGLPPPPGPAGGTGEVIHAIIVAAEMIEHGQVMFFVPQNAQDPPAPPPAPSITAKVDGKAVRAVGADGRPLDIAELAKRLATWTAVVVVPGDLDLPDAFSMKVFQERTVTFMVPRKLLLPMTKAAWARRKWNGPRP
jgi:hypothetical protein